MTLVEKIEYAKKVIKLALSQYDNPVIMTSFGKDSIVLMHLIFEARPNMPCLFHREPYFPEKYAHANRVIEDAGLVVHDFPPMRTYVQESDTDIEIVGQYYCGGNCVYNVPTGIEAPEEGKPYLCGLIDLLNKPTGTYDFKWNLMFIGMKSCDKDPFITFDNFDCDIIRENNSPCAVAYPLRQFTHDDVWEYIDANKLPWDRRRYRRKENETQGQERALSTVYGNNEFSDTKYNPDYFPACTRCISRKQPQNVVCPLSNATIENIWDKVARVDRALIPPHLEHNESEKKETTS